MENSGSYEAEISAWRQEREETLVRERGWLDLDGLFWLTDGQNTLGSDPDNDIVLAAGPPQAGNLVLDDGRVTLCPMPGSGMTLDGQPAWECLLRPDKSGDPSLIGLDALQMIIIERAGRFALRVWNLNRSQRSQFKGRRWYPISSEYRLSGVLSPGDAGQKITIPDVTGMMQEMAVAGTIEFQLAGKNLSLLAIDEGDGDLFVIFRDCTSGSETYPAGRYLYAQLEDDGRVVIDFNKAYNPPCAYTEFATCPLPPARNRLPVSVEAGELKPEW